MSLGPETGALFACRPGAHLLGNATVAPAPISTCSRRYVIMRLRPKWDPSWGSCPRMPLPWTRRQVRTITFLCPCSGGLRVLLSFWRHGRRVDPLSCSSVSAIQDHNRQIRTRSPRKTGSHWMFSVLSLQSSIRARFWHLQLFRSSGSRWRTAYSKWWFWNSSWSRKGKHVGSQS